MPQWNYNKVGVTYDQTPYQYNFLGIIPIPKYYTGLFHTTKALFRRGLGF